MTLLFLRDTRDICTHGCRSHTRQARGKAVKLGRLRAVLLSNGLLPYPFLSMHVPFSAFLYSRSKKAVVVAGIHELLCTRKRCRECSHFRRRKMEMIVKEDVMQEISPSFMASSDTNNHVLPEGSQCSSSSIIHS